MIAVGGDFEAALAFGPNAVLLHELLYALFAHPNAAYKHCPPDAWPAVSTPHLGVNGFDMNQQGVIAEVALFCALLALRTTCSC